MRKKLLSLLLAAAMGTGLLTGCGDNNNSIDDSKDAQESAGGGQDSADAGSSEAGGGSEAEGGQEEMVKLTLLAVDRSSDGKMTMDGGWKETAAGKKLIEDLAALNIEIEFDWIAWDNMQYMNTINARMSSGTDVPDIIWTQYQPEAINAWGELGMVMSADELMAQYDEDGSIDAFYREYGGSSYEACWTNDGKLYYFPNVEDATRAIDEEGKDFPYCEHLGCFMIRKSWMDAIGEEIKEIYTPDELYDLVVKMQEADVNGNGKKDELLITKIQDSEYCGLAYAFGVSTNGISYINRNGKVECISNYESENFVKYIEFLRKCFENGIMTEDVITDIGSIPFDQKAIMYSGVFAADYSNDVDEGEEFVGVMVDYDGDYKNGIYVQAYRWEPTCYSQMAVTSSCKNPEAAVRLMDYMASYDYSLLYQYGVEGLGYEVSESGGVRPLTDPENDETKGLEEIGLNAVLQINKVAKTDVKRIDESIPEAGGQRTNHAWAYDFYHNAFPYAVANVGTWPNKTEEEEEILGQYENALNTRMAECFTDLALGRRSVEEMPAILEELNGLGLQEVKETQMAILQRLYD